MGSQKGKNTYSMPMKGNYTIYELSILLLLGGSQTTEVHNIVGQALTSGCIEPHANES